MKHSKNSKKKRSRNPRQMNASGVGEGKGEEQSMAMAGLAEAFSSISMERVALAYGEAGGDANRAAEILGSLLESSSSTDPCSSSSGWSSSERGFDFSGDDPSTSSTSSERLSEEDLMQLHVSARGKERKSVASMGMVAGVIGKDYMATNKRLSRNSPALKAVREAPEHNEEVEQFIWSMLGEDCELSMEVVRDVLGEFVVSRESIDDAMFPNSSVFLLVLKVCYAIDLKFESLELRKHVRQCPRFAGQCGYNVEKALDALLDLSVPFCDQFKDGNWSHHANNCENDSRTFHHHADSVHGKNADYQSIRKGATERYDAMKSCYQKAAAAYSRGERGYAAYLSEQGRIQNKMAKEADERASLEIFRTRNQGIHNIVTIDLHGQHVQQAIKILKAHLLIFSTYISSVPFLVCLAVQSLRVITGYGHGVAAGKVKQSVIGLLKKECIEWTEENLGSVLIKLNGRRNFSFMNTDQG
ncbi:hypothetical protein Syun_000282 [Stephania yunnanensis]|uniref:Smr domain-containing protein n=1 Tax=Stephania yunnanensis TaxID=152371 RepID=A0AAP0Q561_9MAGN